MYEISSQFNFENLKLGLAQQIYRRPFTAKLKQSISPVKKR